MAAEPKRPPAHVSGAGGPRAAHANLVTINAGTPAKPPLFCVHAEAGDVSLYHAMAGHLSDDQPVLGLCAPAVGELAGEPRIERLAEFHVQAIRAARSEGPYLIVGECTGGALAYEIAQQLRVAGETVALLALVDAFAPGLPRLRRTMPRLLYRMLHRARILGFHFHNLVRLGVGEKLAYAAAKARRAQLALTTKASRRLHRASAGESPQLAFREALAAYTPTSAGGPMVLFRAARLPLGIEPSPDLGWGALVESLQVETVPGYFTTPISEPGVQVLADRLAGHLARVTSAP